MSEADPASTATIQRELRGVLPTGTRLQNYEIDTVLGQGAFGITYRARDTTLNRDVAIKEYLPTSLALREGGTTVVPRSTELAEQFVWGRERFLDEARTLATLDHASAVVRVYDYLEDNGTAYMVMALAHGETLLRRLLSGGPLPQQEIERVLHPLLDGLEQVHATGFLHRDIKPANIILDAKGNPTLIDFGAARVAMVGRSTALTAIFTPGYAAAEQFTSANQGPWTDIYGLSATLYHAITSRPPPSAFERMLEDKYEPLGRLSPAGFAPGLLAGIDAGLAVRMKDRPQSIAEWRSILTGAGGADPATVAMVRPSASPPPPIAAPMPAPVATAAGKRRLGLWVAAGAVAIVVLAGGGYGLFVATRPPTVGTAALSLTAEELARALEERRKADALADEKKKLEDEAQRRAEADAESKRKADEALLASRQQLQKAEEELAKLKADMETRRLAEAAQREQAAADAKRAVEEAAKRNEAEAQIAALRKTEADAKQKAAADAAAKQQADEAAQRKAEAEAAALRQAELEAQKKAAVEAEAKRLADEALAKAQAERQRADAEVAKQKADADAKTKTAAETAENGLRLAQTDRQRLQVALTSLGFNTNGSDGVFGPHSRDMIAAWQKSRNLPQTSFLNAAQRQALLKEAASAVARYDEEQKKAEEARKKAEEEAKAKASATTPPPPPGTTPSPPPAPTAAAGAATSVVPDGPYAGGMNVAIRMGAGTGSSLYRVTLEVASGRGEGIIASTVTGMPQRPGSITIAIAPDGGVSGSGQWYLDGDLKKLSIAGRADGKTIRLDITGFDRPTSVTLSRVPK